MWAKVLALVCAGVFVGAVLVETRRRKRYRKTRSPQPVEDDTSEAQPVASDAQLEERQDEPAPQPC